VVSLVVAFSVTLISKVWADEKHTTWNPTTEERAKISWMPRTSEDVLLTFEGIAMPLGRVLLVRKGADCCAIKFTDTWLGETEEDHYSSYECFYQKDGSGDFTRSNVLAGKGELFCPRRRPIIFDLYYQKGRKTTLICGDIQLKWLFIGWIYFEEYELAPTPWTSISDLNIYDPRVRWYKKNDIKKNINVPVDKLWETPETPEKQVPDNGVVPR
jgi:hypothetical protein